MFALVRLAVVGASLGANLAALAAAEPGHRPRHRPDLAVPRLPRPSSRRGDDEKARYDRPVWLAASTEDPYALRTIKELMSTGGNRDQALSTARAHGTGLLGADPELTRNLMDWLKWTLIF